MNLCVHGRYGSWNLKQNKNKENEICWGRKERGEIVLAERRRHQPGHIFFLSWVAVCVFHRIL